MSEGKSLDKIIGDEIRSLEATESEKTALRKKISLIKREVRDSMTRELNLSESIHVALLAAQFGQEIRKILIRNVLHRHLEESAQTGLQPSKELLLLEKLAFGSINALSASSAEKELLSSEEIFKEIRRKIYVRMEEKFILDKEDARSLFQKWQLFILSFINEILEEQLLEKRVYSREGLLEILRNVFYSNLSSSLIIENDKGELSLPNFPIEDFEDFVRQLNKTLITTAKSRYDNKILYDIPNDEEESPEEEQYRRQHWDDGTEFSEIRGIDDDIMAFFDSIVRTGLSIKVPLSNIRIEPVFPVDISVIDSKLKIRSAMTFVVHTTINPRYQTIETPPREISVPVTAYITEGKTESQNPYLVPIQYHFHLSPKSLRDNEMLNRSLQIWKDSRRRRGKGSKGRRVRNIGKAKD